MGRAPPADRYDAGHAKAEPACLPRGGKQADLRGSGRLAGLGAAGGKRLGPAPRRGGRSLAKIIEHVREADEAYLGGLGARPPKAVTSDPAASMDRLRTAFLATLTAVSRGEPIAEPRNTR